MDPVMSDLNQKIGGVLLREHVLGVLHAHGAGIRHQGPGRRHPRPHRRLGAAPGPRGLRQGPLHQGHDRAPSCSPCRSRRAPCWWTSCWAATAPPPPNWPATRRDALAETFNQIMGSANQALSDLAGETLSISNVEIFSAPGGEAGRPGGDAGPRPLLRPAPGDRPGDPEHPHPPADPRPAGAADQAQAGPGRARRRPPRPGPGSPPRPPPPPAAAPRHPERRPRPRRAPPSRCAPPPRWTPATWTSSWTSNCP